MSDAEDEKADVSAAPEIIVDIGPDLLPSDKALRRYALAILGRAKSASQTERGQLVMAAVRPKVRRDRYGRDLGFTDKEKLRIAIEQVRAESVLEALVRSGRLELVDGSRPREYWQYRYVAPPERLKPDTPEARMENYLAMARNIGRRVGTTERSQARVTDLYLKIRNVYGLHRVDFRDGRAVVVPTSITVGVDGPVVTEALVIAALRRGLKLYEAPADAISTKFGDDNEISVNVDPERCRKLTGRRLSVGEMTVSPFASEKGMGTVRIVQEANGTLSSLKGQRQDVSLYVGEEVGNPAWLSFLASVQRGNSLRKYVRTTIFSILDPEVRTACMRYPGATFELYNWLCGRNDESRTRRLQASAAFPFLTADLREFEEVIDKGEELTPVLAERFRTSPTAIRRLRPLKWQTIGSPHVLPIGSDEFNDLLGLLARTVPEDLPKGRKEWLGAIDVARTVSGTFGPDLPESLAHAFRRLNSTSRLVAAGFRDAIADITGVISRAVQLEWEPYRLMTGWNLDLDDGPAPGYEGPKGYDRRVATAVASAIAGPQGSVKRLASFNNDWHRGVARRLASVNALKRQALGLETKVWEPLTEESLLLAGGTMSWLCNEDALAYEGRSMRHCVGTYAPQCFSGRSHIASVTGPGGVRSTAEFHIRDKTVVLAQHHGLLDRPPPEENKAVVQAFLDLVRRNKSLVDLKALGKAAERRVKESEGRKPGRTKPIDYRMSQEDSESLIRLYDDCLPKALHGLTAADWKARIDGVARQGRKEADESPLDRVRRMTECQSAA